MKSHEIVSFIKKLPELNSQFSGVYAIDQIPSEINYRHFIIVNTDASAEPGTHWYIFSNHTGLPEIGRAHV
jgi:hypothetical protein